MVEAWSGTLLAGYQTDPGAALGETFPVQGAPTTVMVTDVPFISTCPHHLLPMSGLASIAFLPKKVLPGFGRLAGFVDALAHRLVLQEELTRSLADALHLAIDAEAVAVRLEARHFCVAITEPARKDARFITSAIAGKPRVAERLLQEILAARAEPKAPRER